MMAATESRIDIVPVIDLKAGQVVHAHGGRRDEYRPIATPLSPTSAPADVIAGLLRLFPFKRLYVADLDAIERQGDHAAILVELAAAHPGLELWVDNGAGSIGFARDWMASVPAHLVIGSESQNSLDLIRALRSERRVVLSLDFRTDSFQGPAAILEQPDLWPDRVIAMTLARVGGATGPDLGRIRELAMRAGTRLLYAAGGVRDAEDLRAAASAGAAGALVATALHKGALTAETLKGIAQS
jgi:phosphoribosylformimino-5-aminoimidazole carboxamide ribotide isomerase